VSPEGRSNSLLRARNTVWGFAENEGQRLNVPYRTHGDVQASPFRDPGFSTTTSPWCFPPPPTISPLAHVPTRPHPPTHTDDKAAKIAAVESDVAEAEALIRRMDLEARPPASVESHFFSAGTRHSNLETTLRPLESSHLKVLKLTQSLLAPSGLVRRFLHSVSARHVPADSSFIPFQEAL